MNNTLKIVLLIFAVILVGFFIFFYVSFFGLPWKKWTVGNDIKNYLENKYEEPFHIEDRFYNFKDGSYNIAVYPEKDPSLIFHAGEGYGKYKYVDYYAEEIWERQAEADLKKRIKEIYPEASRISAHAVYGEAIELVTGPNIPSYKDVKSLISIHVNLPRRMDINDEEFIKILKLVEIIKVNGGYIDLFIVFEPNETDSKDTTYVTIMPEQMEKIKTIDDVKKFFYNNN